ncbi:hypothetical protein JCM6882_006792 [Rhodosporidiobolus microsporus]
MLPTEQEKVQVAAAGTLPVDHLPPAVTDLPSQPPPPLLSRSFDASIATQDAPTLFDLAHSSKAHHHSEDGEGDGGQHGRHIDAHHGPLSWWHLFKRPIVRQWMVGGILAREQAHREAARFELFFDLVFVGIIHQLAERAAEETSSWAIFKFAVFFYLAWSIWQDVRQFVNVSGTDDVPQRLYVLLVMALLLGFSANASAVAIECAEHVAEEEEGELLRDANEAAHALVARAESALGGAAHLSGGCELAEGWAKNTRGALAFYLVAKLVRVLLLIFYGTWLPRFRTAHFVRAAATIVSCVWWLPLTALETPGLFLSLPIVAIGLELASGFIVPALLKITHSELFRGFCRRTFPAFNRRKGHMHSFLPAINVEHSIERMNLFIIVVLGEMILNVTFSALGPEAGIHLGYLRSVFGLVIAYTLNWLYADCDAARTFLHALRRHWFTAVMWAHLHFPLAAALILVSVAIASFVKDDEPTQSMRWLFGGGLSVILLCLTLVAILNIPLDQAHSPLLPRPLRLLFRLCAALVFALLPLADTLSSTELLGIVVALLVVLCAAETAGKVGSIADEEKVRWATSVSPQKREGGVEETAPEALRRELGGVKVSGVEEGKYDLTDLEKGEDDAGVEADLGEIRVVRLETRQRMAYAF